MEDTSRLFKRVFVLGAAILVICALSVQAAFSQPVPGGTLDPLTIPKYVTPLVIPPVMPQSTASPAPVAQYDIAVRQFQQQILPGPGNAATMGNFPSTTVWSYGREEDPTPALAPVPLGAATPSSFNYPAWTVEATSNSLTTVRWINGLESAGVPLPYLIPGVVDQTLHWANPALATLCAGTGAAGTDCRTNDPTPYTGAVPMVVHVHGAHVNPESDGYPEAWWLPASASNATYALTGTLYDQYIPGNSVPGSAYYGYENDQPATTLWYHDHTLGMTRLNVYAGPAGFWLIRGGANGDANVDDGTTIALNDGTLPGPAPAAGEDPNFVPVDRAKVREIPIAIQDRSFNADGSLFYPDNRAFFEGLAPNQLKIPFIGDPAARPSDISPIWNPEAFFNTMVVNGVSWPVLNVRAQRYRFRLLNGCNSRFLNLAMFAVDPATNQIITALEIPFWQIGAEQGFLPKVVKVQTGFTTTITNPGVIPAPSRAPDPMQALLMGPAERADVIVDFGGLPTGTIVRMVNTAPDAPFGGFPDIPADPGTTGQVMQFVVGTVPLGGDLTTPPENLVLPAEGAFADGIDNTQYLTLNEEVSASVCVAVKPSGQIKYLPGLTPNPLTELCVNKNGKVVGVAFAPKAALLGTAALGPLKWSDAISENPVLGSSEEWQLDNLTVDAHPIHLHLVRFQVLGRGPAGTDGPLPMEAGWKDTVIAYPGEVTRVVATFDVQGLYVWHCHIVEHEDNEMMRPYEVVAAP